MNTSLPVHVGLTVFRYLRDGDRCATMAIYKNRSTIDFGHAYFTYPLVS
jgi:hypothetical protein